MRTAKNGRICCGLLKINPQESTISKQNPEVVLADIEGEPTALETFVSAYAEASGPSEAFGQIGEGRWDRLLLIGMGSSAFAARDCAISLRHRGFDAHAELASTPYPQPPSARTLCVLVSASGTTAETVEAYERHRGVSTTVAVSARGDGPMAAADLQLPLIGSSPRSEAAVQTFQLTVAALQLLEAQLAGEATAEALDSVRRGSGAIAALLEGRARWLGPLAEATEGKPIFLAAACGRTAGADQGALLLREGPRIFADSVEIGDWSHSDVYLSARPGYQLILFGGSRWEPELLDWMRQRQRPIFVIGDREHPDAELLLRIPGAADRRVAAIAETTVVELLAAELWRRSLARGGDPRCRQLVS